MKVNEILIQEETLQAALKRLMKKGGTLGSVLSSNDIDHVLDVLRGSKKTDNVFTMKSESPMTSRLVKSVVASPTYATAATEEGDEPIRIVRMMGGAKILVMGQGDNATLVMTANDYKELVESKEIKDIYSKKKKEQEQIDPKVTKNIIKKSPKLKNGEKIPH